MIAIILAWLLANTWLGLVLCRYFKILVDSWMDLRDLLFLAIISPVPFLIIRGIAKLIKIKG